MVESGHQKPRVGVITLAVFSILALGAIGNFHFVNTTEGFRAYPKSQYNLRLSYLDLRSLSFVDLRSHVEVVDAVVQGGDGRLLPGGELVLQALAVGQTLTSVVATYDDEHQLSTALTNAASALIVAGDSLDRRFRVSSRAAVAAGRATDALAAGLNRGASLLRRPR